MKTFVRQQLRRPSVLIALLLLLFVLFALTVGTGEVTGLESVPTK